MADPGYQEFNHTADAGLRIHGDSPNSLFINAARGMFSLLLPPEDRGQVPEQLEGEPVEFPITVQAPDLALLLREWLGELLYQYSTERVYFTDFSIDSLESTRLAGRVMGRRFTPHLESRLTEIKAVTYHGLQVTREEDGYHATVIFDI